MTNKAPSWHKPNRSPRKQVEARWMGEETAGSGIGRYIAIPLAIVAAAFLLFGMGSLALHVHQKPTVEAAREAEINAMRIDNEAQRRINAKTHRVPKGTAPSRPAQPSIEDIDPCTSAQRKSCAQPRTGRSTTASRSGKPMSSREAATDDREEQDRSLRDLLAARHP